MINLKEYILEKLRVGDLLEYDEKDFSFYFKTQEGRDKITRMCVPYVHALANTYKGYDPEDIFGFACLGFVKAMNRYDPTRNDDFLKFCAIYIKEQINEYIKDYSKTVRIPRSQQSDDKFLSKQYNVSLDYLITRNSDMDDDTEDIKLDKRLIETPAVTTTHRRDMRIINDTIKNKLKNEFKQREIEIFMSYYGLNGKNKMKGKELAQKYGYTPANITYILNKVHKYLSKELNKELSNLKNFMDELYDD